MDGEGGGGEADGEEVWGGGSGGRGGDEGEEEVEVGVTRGLGDCCDGFVGVDVVDGGVEELSEWLLDGVHRMKLKCNNSSRYGDTVSSA